MHAVCFGRFYSTPPRAAAKGPWGLWAGVFNSVIYPGPARIASMMSAAARTTPSKKMEGTLLTAKAVPAMPTKPRCRSWPAQNPHFSVTGGSDHAATRQIVAEVGKPKMPEIKAIGAHVGCHRTGRTKALLVSSVELSEGATRIFLIE